MVHTADWPEDFNADGKRVAVIGNGASGVQLIPQILPSKAAPYRMLANSSS